MSEDILSGKKILLIEDNEFLSNIISTKLSMVAAEVMLRTDGESGFNAIVAFKPDLILLDIMLPIMNGYEVLEKIAAEKLTALHPVMIISNSGQPVEIKRVLQLGAKDYLVKADFTPEEVLEKARQILRNVEIQSLSAPKGLVAEAANDAIASTPVKVMVVEDDPMLRNMLSVKLSNSHCSSMFTNDGSEAIDLIKQFEPDVVILDLMVPAMDGFEILAALKSDDTLQRLPVIVFSNKSEPTDKQRVMDMGAESYHIKAMTNLNELVSEIKKLASRR